MADPPAAILTSIVPTRAVPDRLRVAVSRVVEDWSYSWDDVTFAGTAELTRGREIWVFAVSAGRLAVGDELESVGGRGAGIGVSAFAGGVIPVTPYQARVYEYLGPGRGREGEPQSPARPQVPTTSDSGHRFHRQTS